MPKKELKRMTVKKKNHSKNTREYSDTFKLGKKCQFHDNGDINVSLPSRHESTRQIRANLYNGPND